MAKCEQCRKESGQLCPSSKNVVVRDHVTGKPIRVIKGEEPEYLCKDCYEAGDYSSLACCIINQAVRDMIMPKGPKSTKKAHALSARGFIFSGEFEFWCAVAEFCPKITRDRIVKMMRGETKYHELQV